MTAPTRIDLGMFATNAEGIEITRPNVCKCGGQYTQRILSERFLAIVEKANAIDTLTQQIPGFWVPVFCPPCERKDIGAWARLAETRTVPDRRQDIA